MAPVWSEMSKRVRAINHDRGGWWRVPFQRDYNVCYNSEYEDYFINGIANIMDTYHIDGVYLDGTSYVRYCFNTEHGCGWYDENGKLHGSYQWQKNRRLFKRLYEVVSERGGQINVHCSSLINFNDLPYIHQIWTGEAIQKTLMRGSTADIDLDYFRTEYIGRNMGVPVEFIAYENRPLWTFEQALASSILHGILPRPNDINHPLELMSGVWKIFDAFPIDKSEWMPYWKNEAVTDNEKVKVSYYRYTTLSGKEQLLAFAVNISATPVEQVTLAFPEGVGHVRDMEREEELGFTFSLGAYGYRILYID
jgi:hypothetical protein